MLWLITAAWALGETAYFGWNVFPRSDAELIADGRQWLRDDERIQGRRVMASNTRGSGCVSQPDRHG